MEKVAIVAELARAGSRLIGHTPEAAAGVESAVRGGIGRLESGAKRVLNTPIAGTPEIIPGGLRGPLRKGVDFAIENPEVLLGTALPIPGGGALAHAGKRALERGINKVSPPAPALMGKLAAEAEDELFLLKIAETNIGQWWEQVGGPHLAKGGSHTEFKKMMENEGFSEPLRAKFTEIAEKKYPKGYNTGRSAGSYGRSGPFKSTQPPDMVSRILKERAVGAGIIAAPLIAAGIYSAMSDSKEDPHTKVPEWKGRVGSYLASAGPMAAVGYSMGQLAGMGRASGNQPLVGAAMGALAGIGVGEMLHQSGEENALKSGLRAARTGKDKKLLREASKTQGKLTGLAAWQQMPLAVIGALHGANPIVHSLAAAAGAFGGGMAEKRHRAAGVEHYDRLKGKQKAAAGAPTRGGFMMASDIPSYRPPRLDRAIQKDGEFATSNEVKSAALDKQAVSPQWITSRLQSAVSAPAAGAFPRIQGLANRARGIADKATRQLDAVPPGPLGRYNTHLPRESAIRNAAMSQRHVRGLTGVDWAAANTASDRSPAVRSAVKEIVRAKDSQGKARDAVVGYMKENPEHSEMVLDRLQEVPSYIAKQTPTRQGFLGRLMGKSGAVDKKKGKEKDSDALPDGVAMQPWDTFKRSKYAMPTEKLAQFVEGLLKEGIAGLKPLSQLEQSSRVGAPRASAPPGPSVADQSKPKGPGFGSGIAGAFKGNIGGTGPVGNLTPMPSL